MSVTMPCASEVAKLTLDLFSWTLSSVDRRTRRGMMQKLLLIVAVWRSETELLL